MRHAVPEVDPELDVLPETLVLVAREHLPNKLIGVAGQNSMPSAFRTTDPPLIFLHSPPARSRAAMASAFQAVTNMSEKAPVRKQSIGSFQTRRAERHASRACWSSSSQVGAV